MELNELREDILAEEWHPDEECDFDLGGDAMEM